MKIAFFDITPFEYEYLEKNLSSDFSKYYYSTSLNSETVVEDLIKDAEILSVFITSSLSRKVLEEFKNLKFIVLRSVGFSHVDIVYAKEKGIKVYNAPHYGDHSIAEYVFALLLNVSRKLIQSSYGVKNQILEDLNYEGVELFGKTIGIVGLGATGKFVYDIAKGFSMNPVYFDIVKDENYNYVSLDELCRISDIISINCPLNDKTLYMFDESKFSIMKNGVIILNTARGEIIKTRALYEALISKKVGFLALDVAESENIIYEDINERVNIDSIKDICFKNYYLMRKIISMDNVIVTPHSAYNTKEAKTRILDLTVKNILSSTKFTS